MANTTSFIEHAVDLFEGLGPVQVRRMFGGHGAYARGVMFCLLDDDELFLKTDPESRPTFVKAGCRPWIYDGRHGPQETSYFRPPDDAHESPDAMLPWATLALDAALRKKRAPKSKPKQKPARRKTPAPKR
jgi:DNA transformation protein